jgi:hypothetical protein
LRERRTKSGDADYYIRQVAALINAHFRDINASACVGTLKIDYCNENSMQIDAKHALSFQSSEGHKDSAFTIEGKLHPE